MHLFTVKTRLQMCKQGMVLQGGGPMERGPNIHYVQFSHSHAQGHTHHNGGGNPGTCAQGTEGQNPQSQEQSKNTHR